MRNNSVAFPLFGMAGGAFIPVFHFLYGEGLTRYVAMILYTLVIVMDWIGGYRASKIDGSYASEYGIAGGFQTAFLLLMPAVGHLIDVILSMPGVASLALTAANIVIALLVLEEEIDQRKERRKKKKAVKRKKASKRRTR